MRMLLLFILFALGSCRVAKPIVVENRMTDSVFVTETLRDTTVVIEPDSAMIRALVECDSLGQAHLKELLGYKAGIRVKPPKITIKENILTAVSKVDSMSIFLTYKERYTQAVRREVETKIVTVNELTFWQELWVKLGKGFAIIAVVGVVFFVVRR